MRRTVFSDDYSFTLNKTTNMISVDMKTWYGTDKIASFPRFDRYTYKKNDNDEQAVFIIYVNEKSFETSIDPDAELLIEENSLYTLKNGKKVKIPLPFKKVDRFNRFGSKVTAFQNEEKFTFTVPKVTLKLLLALDQLQKDDD